MFFSFIYSISKYNSLFANETVFSITYAYITICMSTWNTTYRYCSISANRTYVFII